MGLPGHEHSNTEDPNPELVGMDKGVDESLLSAQALLCSPTSQHRSTRRLPPSSTTALWLQDTRVQLNFMSNHMPCDGETAAEPYMTSDRSRRQCGGVYVCRNASREHQYSNSTCDEELSPIEAWYPSSPHRWTDRVSTSNPPDLSTLSAPQLQKLQRSKSKGEMDRTTLINNAAVSCNHPLSPVNPQTIAEAALPVEVTALHVDVTILKGDTLPAEPITITYATNTYGGGQSNAPSQCTTAEFQSGIHQRPRANNLNPRRRAALRKHRNSIELA